MESIRYTGILSGRISDSGSVTIQDYPDYWTQGESFENLQAHLGDLYRDLLDGGVLSGVQ